jgi:hypothetical protein
LVKVHGDIVKGLESSVFDPVFIAVCCEPILRKDEIGALHGVTVGQTVAHEQGGRVGWVEQSHHGWFTSRAAMPTGLLKERKLGAP